jgi:hypothetical protein
VRTARRCAVSHPFVEKVRQSITGNVSSEKPETERTYTTKHGAAVRQKSLIKMIQLNPPLAKEHAVSEPTVDHKKSSP